MNRVTFTVGQPLFYPLALDHTAQVDEVRRKRVRIVYRSSKGRRIRFRTLTPGRLAAIAAAGPELFPIPFNPLQRGVRTPPKSRSYTLERSVTCPQ